MNMIRRVVHKIRLIRLSRFAIKACNTPQTMSIKIDHAYAVTRALELALVQVRGMDQTAASRASVAGLSLSCPKCGEYNDEARNVAVLGGVGGPLQASAGVTFGGPIVAALGQGRCPGCGGKVVSATFDLRHASQ